ncbi:MAG: DNA-protecting protein DprA, partial [Ruminococcus sp.]|nr:DNA-protecting protein DprA [Ruminococcus sp.]
YISCKKTEKSEIINVSIPENLEDDERYLQICHKIKELLSENPLHVDVISQKLNLNPTELMTALTELEIVGQIRSLPGKMFEIKR